MEINLVIRDPDYNDKKKVVMMTRWEWVEKAIERVKAGENIYMFYPYKKKTICFMQDIVPKKEYINI